ncbi:hypothetical protein F5B21DRAFT_484265 [Xylaria acuta]|nr:hypothetical protein F5B21DRAFT_484265 [Xylaria acuta]
MAGTTQDYVPGKGFHVFPGKTHHYIIQDKVDDSHTAHTPGATAATFHDTLHDIQRDLNAPGLALAGNTDGHLGAVAPSLKAGLSVPSISISKPKVNANPDFDLDLGVVHIKGWVDVTTKMIYVEIWVIGIKIGSFKFGFDDGLKLALRLLIAKGEILFYVKDGALWVEIKVNVLGSGLFHKTIKLWTL